MKLQTDYLIIGAGVGGLSAGARLKELGKNFLIVEANSEVPRNLHNGVHYLHSDNFGTPFPFELKKISAIEEIYDPRHDTFKNLANIPEMMEYSLKVMGTRHPSSIIDPGRRQWDVYLPLSHNMNDLIDNYIGYINERIIMGAYKKIICGERLQHIESKEHIAYFPSAEIEYKHMITTVPMPKMLEMLGYEIGDKFKSTTVHVTNYKTENIVANWLISLYISDPKFPPYRITVLNNIISMESVKPMTQIEEHIVKYHLEYYFDYELESKQYYAWETGRIFGLEKKERDEIMNYTFYPKSIYPVGRYGCWNGKLLMDTTILQAKEIIEKIQ